LYATHTASGAVGECSADEGRNRACELACQDPLFMKWIKEQLKAKLKLEQESQDEMDKAMIELGKVPSGHIIG
jgi:hypothetical protein